MTSLFLPSDDHFLPRWMQMLKWNIQCPTNGRSELQPRLTHRWVSPCGGVMLSRAFTVIDGWILATSAIQSGPTWLAIVCQRSSRNRRSTVCPPFKRDMHIGILNSSTTRTRVVVSPWSMDGSSQVRGAAIRNMDAVADTTWIDL